MRTNRGYLVACFIIGCMAINLNAQKANPIIVTVDKPKAEVKPTMWGVFFEDINFGADGGIYAEMVKNRSFEFYKPRTGWKIDVSSKDSSHFLILNRGLLTETNPRYARLTLKDGTGRFGITNTGFRGMGVKKDLKYNFSIMASLPAESSIVMRVELISEKGEKIGETSISPKGREWKKYEASLVSARTDLKASLRIWFEGKGSIDFDLVSLFPGDTWKGRQNGLRSDLVQLLADMKPGFIRWFNNLTSYGTTNYWVQKLFSTNRGTDVLNISQENKPLTGQEGVYASAVLDKKSGEIILKIVNTSSSVLNKTILLRTSGKVGTKAALTVLQNEKLDAMNTIDNPLAVKPVDKEITLKGKNIVVALDPYSLTVLKVKFKK